MSWRVTAGWHRGNVTGTVGLDGKDKKDKKDRKDDKDKKSSKDDDSNGWSASK